MRTLYLDCGMGAAGDMLTAALIELLPQPDLFLEELNALSIPGVRVIREKAVKCGITGTHISVKIDGIEEEPGVNGAAQEHSRGHHHDEHHDHDHHDHDHHDHDHDHDHHHDHHHHHSEDHPVHVHRSMQDIEQLISKLALPRKVQEDVLAVYRLIAEAESHVHGVPVTEIHFHEVGMMDAIADVTAVCMLMEKLSPDEVIVSPVHVGSGQVKCAHGTLPVPAPATAYLLHGVPVYSGNIRGELCTPTGAALLRHFATRFDKMPVMKLSAVGYGMGKKDFEAANCVRAMLGESEDKTDVVLELSCNVDDMTAEAVSYAMERLLEKGALEVYTIPIGMKKSRPGTLLRVMCQEEKKEEMLSLLFCHTTTLGVRETVTHRYVLKREIRTLDTPYGPVRRKDSSGYGISRFKYEYEDLARIAREEQISLEEARRLIEQSMR